MYHFADCISNKSGVYLKHHLTKIITLNNSWWNIICVITQLLCCNYMNTNPYVIQEFLSCIWETTTSRKALIFLSCLLHSAADRGKRVGSTSRITRQLHRSLIYCSERLMLSVISGILRKTLFRVLLWRIGRNDRCSWEIKYKALLLCISCISVL